MAAATIQHRETERRIYRCQPLTHHAFGVTRSLRDLTDPAARTHVLEREFGPLDTCSRLRALRILQQDRRRNTKAAMQSPDHRDTQWTFARQNFRYATPRPNKGHEIPRCQSLLVHSKLDRFQRLWRSDRVMASLVVTD